MLQAGLQPQNFDRFSCSVDISYWPACWRYPGYLSQKEAVRDITQSRIRYVFRVLERPEHYCSHIQSLLGARRNWAGDEQGVLHGEKWIRQG